MLCYCGLLIHIALLYFQMTNRSFPCESCSKSFRRLQELSHHIQRVHDGTFNVICDQCSKPFVDNYDLKRHVANVHATVKKFNCDICEKGFGTRSHYVDHMTKVHDDKLKAHCEYCGKVFYDKKTLKRHVMIKHRPEDCPYECPICLKRQPVPASLNRHILQCHKGHDEVKCDFCAETFPHQICVDFHIKKLHKLELINKEPRTESFHCQQCDNSFSNYEDLQEHILGVHEAAKDFVCSVCRKGFSDKKSLDKHIERTHLPNSKMFPCNKCGKEMKSVFALNQHILSVHNRDLCPFECDICYKKFSRSSHLSRHLLDVHPTELSDNVKCELCEEKFHNDYLLTRHIKAQHPSDKSSGKTNICKICNRAFGKPCHLTRHLATIHGKRPDENENGSKSKGEICKHCGDVLEDFKTLKAHILQMHKGNECEHCGNIFVDLKSHILAVHNRDACKHKCHICPKRFSKPSSLVRHVTEVHGEMPLEKDHDNPGEIKEEQIVDQKEIKVELDPIEVNSYLYTGHDIKQEIVADQEESYVIEDTNDQFEFKAEPMIVDDELVYVKQEVENEYFDNYDQEDQVDDGFLHDNKIKEDFDLDEQFNADHKTILTEGEVKANDFVKCETCCTVFKSILDCDAHSCVPKDKVVVDEQPAPDLPHKCDQCDKQYLNKGSLRRHVRDEHENEDGKFQSKVRGTGNFCVICNTQFDQSYLLKLHMKKAHNVATNQLPGTKAKPKLKCKFCDKVYFRKESVRRHIRDSHEDKQPPKENKGTFPCDQCDKTYDLKGKLRRHIRIVHEAVQAGYCDSCDGAFFRDITRHMIVSHTNQKPIECPDCHKTIGKNYSLQRHLKQCQGLAQNQGPKLCDICGTECENQIELRKHKKKVHLVKSLKRSRIIEKVPCPHCGKSLAGKTALNLHIRTIHEKRRDFMCNECGKCFTQSVALQTHIKGVHSAEKRAGYACPKCDKVWTSERGRQLHMEKTHNEKYLFGCQFCQEKFEFKPLLKAHLDICSPVK